MKFLTIVHPAQILPAGPAQDAVEVMPLLMCKDNFIFDPSEFNEFRSANERCSFNDFVARKFSCFSTFDTFLFIALCFEMLKMFL